MNPGGKHYPSQPHASEGTTSEHLPQIQSGLGEGNGVLLALALKRHTRQHLTSARGRFFSR
jgi:hypothetical protein